MIRIGSMLEDILAGLVHKPITGIYPAERKPTPSRLRGQLQWDASKCTGCMLCVKDCPADAIQIKVIDRKAKIFQMDYYKDRCVFCAQCVQNCRFDCLSLSSDLWEMASGNTELFKIEFAPKEVVDGGLESRPAENAG